MKVIIVGATGFLGSEVLRQALARNDVTSVVAVTRRALPTSLLNGQDGKDGGGGINKVTNVVVKDYDIYDPTAKEAFEGAGGCIWTIAITPRRSKSFPWEEVVRVCQTSTLVGLRTMFESGAPANPFRFLYVSGSLGERDPGKKQWYMPEYAWMRGATETKVLSYAASHAPALEVTIAKPGLIIEPGNIAKNVLATGLRWTGIPSIGIAEISKAMLDQVVNGFEKDTLENADLVRLGKS